MSSVRKFLYFRKRSRSTSKDSGDGLRATVGNNLTKDLFTWWTMIGLVELLKNAKTNNDSTENESVTPDCMSKMKMY